MVESLPRIFDHCPIMVDTMENRRALLVRRDVPFRFRADRALEKEFEDQVKQEWISTEKGLTKKLKDL
ncbi:hypothetical protein EPI10_025095 [Gossypium australe]|uniref:Uncharacterized protein n=1 Tax=Gossypium australe TaxID=47621 RepID=A0A5B6W158_9ROSI|nr:hypothetical protein EPI10_025095 [Gossypium australe]